MLGVYIGHCVRLIYLLSANSPGGETPGSKTPGGYTPVAFTPTGYTPGAYTRAAENTMMML